MTSGMRKWNVGLRMPNTCCNSHWSPYTKDLPDIPTLNLIMATTGLASAAHSNFDAVTPPKPSSLPGDLVKQLLVNLDDRIETLKSKKQDGLDVESLLAFQRVANYL